MNFWRTQLLRNCKALSSQRNLEKYKTQIPYFAQFRDGNGPEFISGGEKESLLVICCAAHRLYPLDLAWLLKVLCHFAIAKMVIPPQNHNKSELSLFHPTTKTG